MRLAVSPTLRGLLEDLKKLVISISDYKCLLMNHTLPPQELQWKMYETFQAGANEIEV